MLTALYEDSEILVIDKPPGLATQPGAGISVSLVEAVERDFGFRPFLVHRLDRDTAGCIIVARDSRSAARWTEIIAGREVVKTYRAIVAGSPPAAFGTLDMAVRVRGTEKSATTLYQCIGTFGPERGYSLLELELGTGRTHQIRLQLASAGCPILGDDAHGDFPLNKLLRKSHNLRRLLLHALRLVLPGSRQVVSAEPEHFTRFLALFPDAPARDSPP
ncbi:MAG: RluA family pseudouridine synthase [Spirochaetota bacterium]